ncbi:hypothetical protein JOE40_003632 [Arthrobacter sp. PvP102]|uniref:hypothetical protein n=1 Tax=unclassified Arthrobacter TaxID=235627 RepID=UPI001AE5F082|nr:MULTISPECIES: hypothetical protein [unclassified Arthrobacter]MBP1233989.1 hypothetical protein [Arthrobacter sp. PvP103]MBP1239123.1 hypothetical protein [Arthrobacter sp. PvP102]
MSNDQDIPDAGGEHGTGSLPSVRTSRKRTKHPRFRTGEHVRFADGHVTGTGVVDDSTRDGSVLWVWADGGNGRRMLLQGRGTSVESLT